MTNQEWEENRKLYSEPDTRPGYGRNLAGGQHNLSVGSWQILDAVLEALQNAEEIWGPGEEEYAPLMLAVAQEAQLRLCGFIENLRERCAK